MQIFCGVFVEFYRVLCGNFCAVLCGIFVAFCAGFLWAFLWDLRGLFL